MTATICFSLASFSLTLEMSKSRRCFVSCTSCRKMASNACSFWIFVFGSDPPSSRSNARFLRPQGLKITVQLLSRILDCGGIDAENAVDNFRLTCEAL